ncbi:HMCN2-like protein [Mya arenaria]|uniref:HMCN2-like protein n=1 Tax=Mya arenaria TaxID=6604 RepID=A0ABY7E4P3_MYAAR|nr:HMCN2-like protein [Mya arenaria]
MATTLFAIVNTTVTLLCQSEIHKPHWRGPPLDDYGLPTVYNYKGSDIRADYPKLHFASNNRDLDITGVQVIDSGTYTCSNTGQNLIVRVPPALPNIYNSTSVSQGELTVSGTEGTQLTLTCLSAGGHPQQTVNWYRGSVTSTPLQAGPPNVVSGDLFNVTRSYSFTPTSSDDGVMYICQSSYSGEPHLFRITKVKLFLKLQPTTPLVTVSETVVESSSSIQIAQCISSGFRPKAVIFSWSLGGETATSVSKPTVVENTTSNTFSVSETYTQVVDRADNRKTLTCSINHETLSSPLPPSTATLTGYFTAVADGSSKTFTCESGTSNPFAAITWLHNNVIVTAGTGTPTNIIGKYYGLVTTQTLTITPTRDDDADVYSCSARNAVSSTPANNAPVVKTLPRTVTETQPGLLQCVVSSKPSATITWYQINDGRTFLLEGTGNKSLDYRITAVSRDDAGTYMCNANNGIGGDNFNSVQLVVQFKPDVTVFAHNATEKLSTTLRTGTESPEHHGLSIYESVDPKGEEATYSELDRNQARTATESPEHIGLPIYESLKSKAKDATYSDLDTHTYKNIVFAGVL